MGVKPHTVLSGVSTYNSKRNSPPPFYTHIIFLFYFLFVLVNNHIRVSPGLPVIYNNGGSREVN